MGKVVLWTKEEIEYLKENWGNKSQTAIANHLGRSVNAVKLKANKLGLKTWVHSADYMTLYELLTAIGLTYCGSLCDKLVANGFPVIEKKPSYSQRIRVVQIDKFWKWAETHQDVINFRRFEYGALGPEPEWVNAKRAKDRHKKNTRWTRMDDEILKSMAKQYKYTAAEMAERLQRSEPSILRRLYDLNVDERPIIAR